MYPKAMIVSKMRLDIEHLQYRYQEWPSDMCGLCAIAAIELALRFRKYGYKSARAVWGYIEGEWGDHCWVELDGEIFDVTATQFGDPEIVRVSKNKATHYMTYNEDGSRKDGVELTDCEKSRKVNASTYDISKGLGRRKLMTWPPYQRPQPRFTKVLRG